MKKHFNCILLLVFFIVSLVRAVSEVKGGFLKAEVAVVIKPIVQHPGHWRRPLAHRLLANEQLPAGRNSRALVGRYVAAFQPIVQKLLFWYRCLVGVFSNRLLLIIKHCFQFLVSYINVFYLQQSTKSLAKVCS